MKHRIKDLYLDVGRVLNNPEAFGLEERPPTALIEALTRIQMELIEELREQGFELESLHAELSQADEPNLRGMSETSFTLCKSE